MGILQKYLALAKNEEDLLVLLNNSHQIIDVMKKNSKIDEGEKRKLIGSNLSALMGLEATDKLIEVIKRGQGKKLRKSLDLKCIKNHTSQLFHIEVIYDEDIVLILSPYNHQDFAQTCFYYYKEFFDMTPNCLLIVNLDVELIRINSAFANAIGRDQDEVIGHKLIDYIHPEDHDKIPEISRIFATGNNFSNYKVKIKTMNLGYRVFEMNGFLKDNLVYVVARDISEEKAIKEMLVNSKLNYQNMFNSIDDFILIARLDGQIIYGNYAHYQKLGYTMDNLKTKNIIDLHPPGFREEAINNLKEVLAGKRNDNSIPLVSIDGNVWPVSAKVWFGQWDGQEAIYCLSKDLSVEEELLVRFNKVFQSNPNYMTIHNHANEDIINANQAFLQKFDFTRDEVIGRTYQDLGFKSSLVPNGLKNYIKHKEQTQKKYYLKDTEIDVLHSVESIKSITKDYLLSVMVDITELNEVKDNLEQVSKIQDILMKLATEFINIPLDKVDESILAALELMGKFMDVDRIYIFDYLFEKEVTSNTYEWCSQYATKEIENLQNIPLNTIDTWVEKHINGEIINITNVSSLSNKDSVKEILELQNIKSLLTVPMILEDKCVGFAGFDAVRETRVFSNQEIKLLHLFVQMLVNIRHRKQQEDQLYSQIKERELLIKEIHHRVKNNLQIISSFIYLQGQFSKDRKVKNILSTINNRVKAMAILHEKIYKGEKLDQFKFKEYLEEINRQLFEQYAHKGNLKLELEIEDININFNRAISIGLVVNELVANSVQHAFSDQDKGTLTVKVFAEDSNIIIIISDDGIGCNNVEINKSSSLGLVIVDSLIEQLGGQYFMENHQGTEYYIELPIQNLI